MENHRHTRAGGFQKSNDAWELQGKAASGPGESRVLNQHPGVAPRLRLEMQRAHRLPPAVKFPRHAANLQLKFVRLESIAQIPAVFLHRVRGHVFAAKKREARSCQ